MIIKFLQRTFFCILTFGYISTGFGCVSLSFENKMFNENDNSEKKEEKEFKPMFDFSKELSDIPNKSNEDAIDKDQDLNSTRAKEYKEEMNLERYNEISCVEEKYEIVEYKQDDSMYTGFSNINNQLQVQFENMNEELENNTKTNIALTVASLNISEEEKEQARENGQIVAAHFMKKFERELENNNQEKSFEALMENALDIAIMPSMSVVRLQTKKFEAALDMRSKNSDLMVKSVENNIKALERQEKAMRKKIDSDLKQKEKEYNLELKVWEDKFKAQNRVIEDRIILIEKEHATKIKMAEKEHKLAMEKIDDALKQALKKEDEKLKLAKKAKLDAAEVEKVNDEVQNNKKILAELAVKAQHEEVERHAKKLAEQESEKEAARIANEKTAEKNKIELERQRQDMMLDEMKRKQDLALEELEKKYRLEQEKKRAELDYKAKVDQEIEDKAFRLSVLEGLENTKRIAAKAKAPSSFITSINKTISEAEKGKMDFCQIEHDPRYDNHDIAVGIDGSFNGIFTFKGAIKDKSSWTILTYGNKKRYKGNSSWGNDHLVQNMW